MLGKRCVFVAVDGWMVCQNEGCSNRMAIINPATPAEKYNGGGCGRKRASGKPTPMCRHLGMIEAEPALIPCTTCQGNVRRKYPVAACEIYQRCLPTYVGEVQEGLHQCHGCQDYQL